MTSVLQTSTITAKVIDTTVGGLSLAAFNRGRRQLAIASTVGAPVLYVALGSVVSAASYTVLLNPGDYWELPTFGDEVYIGPVFGLAATGSGTYMVTEVAP